MFQFMGKLMDNVLVFMLVAGLVLFLGVPLAIVFIPVALLMVLPMLLLAPLAGIALFALAPSVFERCKRELQEWRRPEWRKPEEPERHFCPYAQQDPQVKHDL